MGSSVDFSILPASSMLSVLAPADEGNSSSDLTSMTSPLTSLSFVIPDKHIAHINNELLYNDMYNGPLPYGNGTPMDDALLS